MNNKFITLKPPLEFDQEKQINKILSSNKYIILDKKIRKNKKTLINTNYQIIDNLITLCVDIKNLKCQCNVKYCNHLLVILANEFNFTAKSLANLKNNEHIFDKTLSESKDKSNVGLLFEKLIIEYLDSMECPICFYNFNEGLMPYKLYICNVCKITVHCECIIKWYNYENKDGALEKQCIHCRSKIQLNH